MLGPPETDKLTTQPFERCERMVFKGSMRAEQLAPANAMFEALGEYLWSRIKNSLSFLHSTPSVDKIGGGVISLQCGGGNQGSR